MELTPWTMYLILQLDSLIGLFTGMAAFIIISALVMMVAGTVMRTEQNTELEGAGLQKKSWWLVALFTALVIASTITPTTKTALMIWTVPAIANNEGVQQLPDKLIKMLNGYLDEKISGASEQQ